VVIKTADANLILDGSCAESEKTVFKSKERGFCVKQNGGDQNSGVILLDNLDYFDGDTPEEIDSALVEACLDMCACYNGNPVTGCEMIWDQSNRGCYVHTATIDYGNGVDRHSCYITNDGSGQCAEEMKTTFGDRRRGFCVKSNGADQNSGVVKLRGGNFYDTDTEPDEFKVNECLNLCACYEGAPVTGCEMIWDQHNRGCYVHTDRIAKGNNVNRHSCYLANGGVNFRGSFGEVCTATAWGDPHIVTFDGLRVRFHLVYFNNEFVSPASQVFFSLFKVRCSTRR
jgi:hypothetical protein